MMQYVLKNGIILDGTENMKPVTGHMIRIENDKIAEILPEDCKFRPIGVTIPLTSE